MDTTITKDPAADTPKEAFASPLAEESRDEPIGSPCDAAAKETLEAPPPQSESEYGTEDEDPLRGLREEVTRRAEAEGLLADHPDFDPEKALAHPVLGKLLRGEPPTLRQLYEMAYLEEILESRLRGRLDGAVEEALASALPDLVKAAVLESEERLLSHIRARGCRPLENGLSASGGEKIPSVAERLTRRERAMLARRAERGETIRL